MAKFTVMLNTYHYVEADDALEAAAQVRDSLPEGTGIQNIQIVPGTQQFTQND